MYLCVEILFSFFIAIIPYIIFRKKENDKKIYVIISCIILLIGCLIRTVAIESYPIGLNQDEASIGYEAYSILNYGIDRNGYSFPVHFEAWGSGQNALYGYIIIPFVKLFDLNNFSVRFPMAIVGCITLLVSYFLFNDIFDRKKSLIAIFIFAIIPWHILKSRWGLESNLFPDLVFWAVVCIYYGIKNNKSSFFIIASCILGLSVYSYGTSYLFVPIFLVLMYLYLILKKKISLKNSILYFSITGLIALPMFLFVIINYYKLDTITIFNITIPRLAFSRFTTVTAASGNILQNCFNNIKDSFFILLKQSDGLILNYSPVYGILYNMSLPFIIIGLATVFIKKEDLFLKINTIFFISSLAIVAFTNPNINRINIIWIPIIIYLIYGVLWIYEKEMKIGYALVATFLIAFIFFSINYFNDYQENIGNATFNGLENCIKWCSDKKYKKLYITSSVNQPYIFYLFYNQIETDHYIYNRTILNKNDAFQKINNIGNVYFSTPTDMEEDCIYIVNKDELDMYDTSDMHIEYFDNYCVIF